MAVVDDARGLGGIDVMVSEVARPVKDATSLVAKAAATFGLPNLLHHTRASSSSSSKLVWQASTESCCSCTPLACMTHDTRTRRQQEERVVQEPPSPDDPEDDDVVQSVETLENFDESQLVSNLHDLNCNEGEDTTANYGPDNERGHLSERVVDESSGEGTTDVAPQGVPPGEDREQVVTLPGKEESGTHRKGEEPHHRHNVSPLTKRVTFRRRVADYEREWTFQPKLNIASLRLVSQVARSRLPVCHRLYEQRRPNNTHQLREDFTFCPKLNATSLRLAKERAERLPEVLTVLLKNKYCLLK